MIRRNLLMLRFYSLQSFTFNNDIIKLFDIHPITNTYFSNITCNPSVIDSNLYQSLFVVKCTQIYSLDIYQSIIIKTIFTLNYLYITSSVSTQATKLL